MSDTAQQFVTLIHLSGKDLIVLLKISLPESVMYFGSSVPFYNKTVVCTIRVNDKLAANTIISGLYKYYKMFLTLFMEQYIFSILEAIFFVIFYT